MNPESGYRRWRLGELLLWTIAGLAAFAVHAGAVALLLAQPVDMAASDAPPMAVMIEMAPEPVAEQTEESEIVPDTEDAEEVKTASVVPLPEPVMPPIVEPPPELVVKEPVEEPTPEPPVEEEVVEEEPIEKPVEQAVIPPPIPEQPVEQIDPIEQQVMTELENVEVPMPMARPPVVEKPQEVAKLETPKPTPKKVVRKVTPPPAPSQASKKASAQVQKADRTGASATSAGSSQPSVSPARWQSRLMAHLERRKRYPADSRSKGEQGTVYVSFRIDGSGNVLSVSLSRTSGYPALDQSVVEMVRRASPVPAPPPGVSKSIVAPVRFNIR